MDILEKMTGNVSENTACWNAVESAIESHGVDVPEGTPKSDYAEKVDAVYEAGRDSFAAECKTIEATAEGYQKVFLEDVSDVPHEINVQLSSDTITDFSGVEVGVLQGNLFDINGYRHSGASAIKIEGSSITVSQRNGNTYTSINIKIPNGKLLVGVPLTISAKVAEMSENGCSPSIRLGCMNDTSNKYVADYGDIIAYIPNEKGELSKRGAIRAMPEGHSLCLLIYSNWTGSVTNPSIKYEDICISLAPTYDYTPYYGDVKAQVTRDGSVTVRSGHGSMILYTESHASLLANYKKTYSTDHVIRAAWDRYLDGGSRKEFRFAFANSDLSKQTFMPTKNICPEGSAEAMFFKSFPKSQLASEYIDMVELEERMGIVFDFSKCTRFYQALSSSPFTRINRVDMEAFATTANTGYYSNYMFYTSYGGSKLSRVEHLIFHASMKEFSINAFDGWGLTHIGFEGEIACNGIDLSRTYNVDKETIIKLFNCLVDKTGDTSGTTWRVTIGSTHMAKLTEEELAIAYDKGWEVI